MSKIIFKTNKKIDFQNHLIQMKWRDKTGFKYNEKDIEYFRSLENSKDTKEQWNRFEEYSKYFYSKENKENVHEIIDFYQDSWNKVEDVYISKMEEIHKNYFFYNVVLGVLSTSPGGWGFNLKGDNPWFACPNKKNERFLKVAMHEIMHGFFIKYFREKCKKNFGLSNNQLWDVQESLTVLLNIELSDILPQEDLGYPQHQELREEIKKIWLKTKDIDETLNHICKNIRK